MQFYDSSSILLVSSLLHLIAVVLLGIIQQEHNCKTEASGKSLRTRTITSIFKCVKSQTEVCALFTKTSVVSIRQRKAFLTSTIQCFQTLYTYIYFLLQIQTSYNFPCQMKSMIVIQSIMICYTRFSVYKQQQQDEYFGEKTQHISGNENLRF